MKIGIKDAKTIELLDLYGFKAVIVEGDHEIGVSLKTKEANYDVATGFDYECKLPSFTHRVIAILKTLIPPTGTPNSEMTDEQKGFIQLLFEVEKAIEIKETPRKLEKVFLGGTCNESTWRDELMPLLSVEYFNPVVEDWNEEAQKEEEKQKEECDVHLYVITSEMQGVFSIAEAIASANQEGVMSLFFVIPDGFDKAALRSLSATANLVNNQPNGFGFVMHEANKDSYFEAIAASLNDNEVEKAIA